MIFQLYPLDFTTLLYRVIDFDRSVKVVFRVAAISSDGGSGRPTLRLWTVTVQSSQISILKRLFLFGFKIE